ncbi:MAG: hypothetical protein R3B48_11250 [Kofleriaceae bacterium]
MRRLLATWAAHLARPWLAVGVAAVAAALLLLPGLGEPGLWEPQELARADAALTYVTASRAAQGAEPPPAPRPQSPGAKAACPRQAPKDAVARTLTDRLLRWVLSRGEPSEAALRLPLALLGVLTVVASAGIAARLAGGRAALLCALLLLSFPLLTLQARSLTSELGTAAGGALLIYGLLSLRPIGATLGAALRGGPGAPTRLAGLAHLLDDALSLAALLGGLALAFAGGGALLGVLVPALAFAACTGAGRGAWLALGRALRRAGRALADLMSPAARWRRAGEVPARKEPPADAGETWLGAKGLVATALAAVAAYLLVDQTIDFGPLQPGTRQVLGHSILPTSCYSWALGGLWQPSDDLRALFDSSVEQIAFGAFPWGLMAPLAIAALLASPRNRERRAAVLCLAWAASAWVATEAFQRKVGFTIYAAFPALALAIALWIDARLRAPDERVTTEAPLPAGAPLFGLFFLLGAITLGKDLQTFPERLTSLLVGNDAIAYPAAARWLAVPARAWILGLGTAIALAAALWMWRGATAGAPAAPARGRRALSVALIATAALAVYWVRGWQASLSELLSSKQVFATYRAQRAPGDRLVIFGDLGNAPRYYAGGPFEQVSTRQELLDALGAPTRVFALAPASELCFVHRQIGPNPYFVLDNDNPRTLLLSNRQGPDADRNPLAESLYRAEPPGIAERPRSRIVFDNRIELIGWTAPKQVRRGASFEITVYYKILASVGASWRVFQHYDLGGARFSGDHVPIAGRCPTTEWQAGDYVADRHTVHAGGPGTPAGSYELWTGFFTGAAPSWRNMPVSMAPAEQRDSEDRVKLTSISLR